MSPDAHDSRRKHRRSSSPEDLEKSSKRHKLRHRRSHRPRRGSKKRDEEIEYDGGTVTAAPSSTLPPSPAPHSHLPDDDVEEREILEDEPLDGNVGKKQTESDVEPGEIELTGDQDLRSDKKNPEEKMRDSPTASSKKIKLTSSDGDVFEVDYNVALMSKILEEAIEVISGCDSFPVSLVSSKTLTKVIEYCEFSREREQMPGYERRIWYDEFFKVDLQNLFELLHAANYLSIKSLLVLTTNRIAHITRDKAPEAIRLLFSTHF